jgi:diguanylate cyclase (GGDEF)-like protein/PAS domain S-box-containing protein
MKDIMQLVEQFIESSYVGILVVNKNGENLFVNNRLCEMFAYTQAELLYSGIDIFHLNHNSSQKFESIVDDALENGESVEIDFEFKHKDGSSIWIHIAGTPKREDNEILWIMVDITESVLAKAKLKESNHTLQKYLDSIDNIGIGLFVVDEDFSIRYMNKTLQNWFGNQIGKICYSSVAGLDHPCSYCKLDEVIHQNKKVMYEPQTPDGQSFEIVATSVKNSDGSLSKMEFIRNVTQQKKAQESLKKEKEKLDYQAHHDFLTGLPNRVLFNERLEKAILDAKRQINKFAVLFIDLDHFKEINDSLGHDTGDKILTEVSIRLQGVLRDKDTLARLGGDEFIIIIEDLNALEDVSVVASKILQSLSQSIEINTNKLYVSSSIGISIYPDDGESVQNLIKFADSAMYQAKADGRNNYQYYNSQMTALAYERINMEVQLRDAIEREEFVIHYQPQINGINNKIVGMEALVRWQHPTMGLLAPTSFLSVAESTGLIVAIDRYVMRSAMIQFSQWHKQGLSPGKLAMNLAMKQLYQKDFIEFLESLLAQTNCLAQWIVLEVTESKIMDNPQKAIPILHKISDLGIDLAIDDFGTGHSSLAYLKKLPINKLKIDKSFVDELPYNEEDISITKAVIGLAKSLQLSIIAEGVETQAQKNFIVENGCEQIQGFYYSKAVSSTEMEQLLIAPTVLDR